MITVLKHDGTTEEFLLEKIIRVVMAAGLEEAQALSLASDISEWAKSLNISQITTAQIRDQVIARMQKINPYSAGLYKWYENTKDTTSKPT